MPKDPWFKFFPTEWMADAKLRSCKLSTRGFLLELMCLMHQSPKPGYLLIGQNVPSLYTISVVISTPIPTVKRHVKSLLENGVIIEDDGVLVCPRMVRDYALRETRREVGRKGGNPVLVKQDVNPRSKKLETRVKKEITTTEEKNMFSLPDWMPKTTWDLFLDHRKKVKAPVSEKAYPSFIEKFGKLKEAGWSPARVVDIMTEKGWRWFKGEWVKDEAQYLPPPPDTTGEERRALEKARKENPDDWVGPEEMAEITKKFGMDFGKGRKSA